VRDLPSLVPAWRSGRCAAAVLRAPRVSAWAPPPRLPAMARAQRPPGARGARRRAHGGASSTPDVRWLHRARRRPHRAHRVERRRAQGRPATRR